MSAANRSAPAAMLAVLCLLLGIPSPASGATRRGDGATAAAGPPVITEHFKPLLACNPNTTVGMEGCGEHRVIAADSRLDADVRVISGLLSGGAARRDFSSAQAKWLAYRDADCASQSDVYEGGTEQPVAYVDCLAADDGARRADLKGFFALLTQDRQTLPAFP